MGETPGQKISYEIGKLQIIQMLAAAGGIWVLPETDNGVRSATSTIPRATRGSHPGGRYAGRDPKGTAQEEERQSTV